MTRTSSPLHFHLNHILHCAIAAVICLFSLPQHISAQAIEAGYGKGAVLKFDDWLTNDALKEQDAQSFWLGYIYQTHAEEDCG